MSKTSSQKKKCLARFTMESKLITLEKAYMEVEELRNLLANLPLTFILIFLCDYNVIATVLLPWAKR